MQYSRLFLGTIAFFLILGSCSSREQGESFYIDQYFELKSLIDNQIAYYQDSVPPAELTKTVSFSGNSETQQQEVEKIQEVRQVLETAIINKPGYRGVYKTSWEYGTSGGDTTYSIQTNKLKPDESALVQELKAFYNGRPVRENLYRVHIHKDTENLLYHNAQVITIQLQEGLMRKLTMEGNQQILTFQPEQYRLSMRVDP